MEININLFRLRFWPIGNRFYCWMRTYCFGRFCARATLGVKTKWNIRQFHRTKRTFSAHALVSRLFRSSFGHWCFPNLFHTIVESLHNHLPLFTFTNWRLTESIFDTSQQIKNENGARLLLFSPWCDSDDITSMLESTHLSKLLKLYWILYLHASIPHSGNAIKCISFESFRMQLDCCRTANGRGKIKERECFYCCFSGVKFIVENLLRSKFSFQSKIRSCFIFFTQLDRHPLWFLCR